MFSLFRPSLCLSPDSSVSLSFTVTCRYFLHFSAFLLSHCSPVMVNFSLTMVKYRFSLFVSFILIALSPLSFFCRSLYLLFDLSNYFLFYHERTLVLLVPVQYRNIKCGMRQGSPMCLALLSFLACPWYLRSLYQQCL
jgi:hypothetical protein